MNYITIRPTNKGTNTILTCSAPSRHAAKLCSTTVMLLATITTCN